MRHYEIVLIIRPDYSEKIKNIVDLYSSLITKEKGIIHRMEEWGRRQLAYPIQNLYKAYYVLLNVEASKDTISILENDIRLNEAIIRSAVMRVKHPVNTLSPMAKLNSDAPCDDKAGNHSEK